MKLPKELEQSVKDLIQQDLLEFAQKTRETNAQAQKEREQKIVEANQLIEEIRSSTGLDCLIDESSLDGNYTEIIFEFKEWEIILIFREWDEESIGVSTFCFLADYGRSGWVVIEKKQLKNWVVNELAKAKLEIERNSKLPILSLTDD
jgi:hypothetical protein